MSHLFDIETEPSRVPMEGPDETNAGRWTTRLSGGWNIGENSNGGYLVAAALRAMSELTEQPDLLTVTTHFLRPGIGEEDAVIDGRVVKHGRTMTTIRGAMHQQGKQRVEVTAGFGSLDAAAGERALTVGPPDVPDPASCVDRKDLEQGVDLPIMQRLDVRIHPHQAVAGRSDEAKVSGWIRHIDGREPDTTSLALFCDAFPPSVFALYGYIGWVPSLELTTQIRRRPAPGWICAELRTDDLHNGLFVETGSLWDSTGELVARVRQLAMLRTR